MSKNNSKDILEQIAVLNSSKLSPVSRKEAMKRLERSIVDLEKGNSAAEADAIKGFRKQFKELSDHLSTLEAKHDVVNASFDKLGALSKKDQGKVDDLMKAALKENQDDKNWIDSINRRNAALKSPNIKATTSTKTTSTVSKPHPIEGKIPRVDDLEKYLANRKLETKTNSPTKPLNQGVSVQPSSIKSAFQRRGSAGEALESIKNLQYKIKTENFTSKRLVSKYNKMGESPQERQTITWQLQQSREKLTNLFNQLVTSLKKLAGFPEYAASATKQLEGVNHFLKKEAHIRPWINEAKVIKPITTPSPVVEEARVKTIDGLAPASDSIVGGKELAQAAEDAAEAELLKRFEALKNPEPEAIKPEKSNASENSNAQAAEEAAEAELLKRFEALKNPEPEAIKPEKSSTQAAEEKVTFKQRLSHITKDAKSVESGKTTTTSKTPEEGEEGSKRP